MALGDEIVNGDDSNNSDSEVLCSPDDLTGELNTMNDAFA